MKIVGVLIGAFLLLGFAFIEPTRNLDQGLRGLVITLGVLACGALATVGIRRVMHPRNYEEVDE